MMVLAPLEVEMEPGTRVKMPAHGRQTLVVGGGGEVCAAVCGLSQAKAT
jgi:hypothetical protein